MQASPKLIPSSTGQLCWPIVIRQTPFRVKRLAFRQEGLDFRVEGFLTTKDTKDAKDTEIFDTDFAD